MPIHIFSGETPLGNIIESGYESLAAITDMKVAFTYASDYLHEVKDGINPFLVLHLSSFLFAMAAGTRFLVGIY